MLPKVVLVADNDVRTPEMVQKSLAPIGALVLTARTGDRALELAHQVRPSVVLLDVDLAGMTAREVAVRLRSYVATATVPIVLLAPPDVGENLLKSLGLDGVTCLPKPLGPVELRALIRRYLD